MTTLPLDKNLTTVIIIFRKDKPYWESIAENEDHLYRVLHTVNA